MVILFILGLVLGALAVVFALQNVAIVTVSFFSWQYVGSLSVVISLALLIGVLIAILLFLPESISNYFKVKKLRKENKKLEEELKKQKVLTVFAKTTEPTSEDIEKIEKAVI